MVTREAPMPSRSAVGGFVSPNMGRGNDEIEMRRKGVWAMAEHGDDKNGGNDERFHVNDDELGDIGPQRMMMNEVVGQTFTLGTQAGRCHQKLWP
ncbi:hypothetical protein F2Q69_00048680 [Brassica cretica]|nr:hypothetical protein F2Q69_00048680 [Brassica cretica]